MTGRREAYFTDYRGTPQELISALRWGYLYQGQYYVWQEQRRGSPALDLPASSFVTFIENHDQLANSSFGQRVHNLTSPGRYRAMTALFLLSPPTPMLFQGQEYGLPKRFQYFADFDGELGKNVREGRLEFLAQFKNLASQEAQEAVADPCDIATFEQCKLTADDRNTEAPSYLLHRDLLRLRTTDPVFRQQRNDRVFGAVLGPESFLIRFFGEDGDDRLLIVNLERDFELKPAPEPLLAPPEGALWEMLWSSDDPAYGGSGVLAFDGIQNVRISGQAALALKAVQEKDGNDRD
jgi:maltooligosyltrehalose trehalohydrolase